jgi:tetratricopeptide (TPR) repeat protein
LIGRYNVPLTQATTSSLLAFKAYSLGEEKHRRGEEEQSVSDFKLAIDLDPQFALAYASLGTAYMNMRNYAEARADYSKAYALRGRTTERERLYIAAQYSSFGMGDIDREIEAYRLWTNVYPRDTLPLENLANAYLQLGQPNEALRMAQASIRLAPSSSAAYALESRAYLSLGRYGELNKLCSDPARNNSRMMPFHASCWLGAFAQGNSAAQQKELAWAQESPQRSVMLEYAAWGDLYQGKAKQAAATFDEARRSTAAGNMTEFVAELDLDEALLDADTGLDAEAQQHALHALQVGPGSGYVQAAAALALARSGDTDRARLELRKAASQVMGNATLDKPLLASVRAAIALQEHNPEAAVQQMQAVRAFDDVAFMTLSPAYYRGLALLDLRHYAAADAAFRGVIAHRMLYPESVYSKLAQLSLGRSLMLEGKSAEAQEQFRELDARWKDADPGFAPLQELQVWKSSPRSR